MSPEDIATLEEKKAQVTKIVEEVEKVMDELYPDRQVTAEIVLAAFATHLNSLLELIHSQVEYPEYLRFYMSTMRLFKMSHGARDGDI